MGNSFKVQPSPKIRQSIASQSARYDTFPQLEFHKCDQGRSESKHIVFCLCLLTFTRALSSISAFGPPRAIGQHDEDGAIQYLLNRRNLLWRSSDRPIGWWPFQIEFVCKCECECVSDENLINRHACTMSASASRLSTPMRESHITSRRRGIKNGNPPSRLRTLWPFHPLLSLFGWIDFQWHHAIMMKSKTFYSWVFGILISKSDT
jgi:hypothetical protein